MINPASRTKSIELSLIRKMFEVTNPNGKSLTYKYFNANNYDTTVYNLKIKNEIQNFCRII